MDLLLGSTNGDHIPEEVHEVPARVPSRRLALHLTGLHVQRRVERQRTVTPELERATFDAALRQRQHAVPPVFSSMQNTAA